MNGLRFAMLTTFYPPYNFGGDGIAIERLAKALVRRGHHVTVIHDVDAYELLAEGTAAPPEPQPPGLEIHRLKSGFGPLGPLLSHQSGRPAFQGRRIRRILRAGGFDVVHFHNISLLGGPGLLSVGDGVKVYEAHEHWLVCPSHVLWRHNREACTGRECLRCVLHFRRPPQMWRYTGLLERQLEQVDVFLAKSEFSRRKHAEFGFRREMQVLPYFLSDETAPATPAAESPHPRPYFLFVGRLEAIKGLDDVIPVFARYRDADLLIAGDGTQEEALRAQARGVPGVRFLGRLDQDAIQRYSAHAIALVVPSVGFETFGIVLIEAFRQGTPVVARRIGPFPEIVERCQGGELFSTVEELESALRRLQFEPGLRERRARLARRGFLEHWSERTVVPRYLEIVDQALDRRSPRPAPVAAEVTA